MESAGMSDCKDTDTKIRARGLVAYTDAELSRYLEAHQLEGGAIAVEVDDPENLPEDFFQRLR
jgi:hypothetical protein